jgi:hypothetical protein
MVFDTRTTVDEPRTTSYAIRLQAGLRPINFNRLSAQSTAPQA